MSEVVSVTADTNLLASGLARRSTHPDSAPVQFVQAWLGDRFVLVQSDVLLTELDHTLTKRYFAQRLSQADRAGIRQLVQRRALLTALTVAVSGVASLQLV